MHPKPPWLQPIGVRARQGRVAVLGFEMAFATNAKRAAQAIRSSVVAPRGGISGNRGFTLPFLLQSFESISDAIDCISQKVWLTRCATLYIVVLHESCG